METTQDVQRTLTGEIVQETRCHCGKLCKNSRGLKIHQARAKCRPKSTQEERTVNTGETQEDHSQEEPHSTEDLLPSGRMQDDTPTQTEQPQHGSPNQHHEKIKWPPANDKAWEDLDEDLDKILIATMKGDAFQKIHTMTTLVYAVGKERFGVEEKAHQQHKTTVSNRRVREIKKLRGEIRTLTKQYRKAGSEERIGLCQLRTTLRERMKTLRKAENIRKKRQEKAKQRAAFIKNPYRFTTSLLAGQKSGTLEYPQEEVEDHLRRTHSDPERETTWRWPTDSR